MTRTPLRALRFAFHLTLPWVGFSAACVSPTNVTTSTPKAPTRKPVTEKALDQVFERYFETYLELNPLEATGIGDDRYNHRLDFGISPKYRARRASVDRRYLALAGRFDARKLDSHHQLSLKVFLADREQSLAELAFPGHLLPITPFWNPANYFAELGGGKSLHPFRNTRDYEDFLKRMDGYVTWVDQAIANMRVGMKRGVTNPRPLMEKVLPQLQAHIQDDPSQTVFWQPLKTFPESVSPQNRVRFEVEYRQALSVKVIPAYRRLHAFIRDTYLPACRHTVGRFALPQGKDWYRNEIRRSTTTSLTPEQIHAMGLLEMDRIHKEILAALLDARFEGDLKAFSKSLKEDPRFYFSNSDALIQGYRELKARIQPTLSNLFTLQPKSDFEIRAVEPFREKSASSGQYRPGSPDGQRPGVFYANAYDIASRPKWAMEALLLHEGAPGHHFQISIQQELTSLPKFRRYAWWYDAFTEGWGLYAESLGRELACYSDPYSRFGQLEGELWRALRLVVDTGLHAKGWSRQEAIDYLAAHSPRGASLLEAAVDRYISMPGQALAYKVGELKIQELRQRAQARLGSKFDIREFHSAILQGGALPLGILERNMDAWINAQAKGKSLP